MEGSCRLSSFLGLDFFFDDDVDFFFDDEDDFDFVLDEEEAFDGSDASSSESSSDTRGSLELLVSESFLGFFFFLLLGCIGSS